MSLAPASSLGAFLKARLAVNGIQCAARSFGTLTAAGRGLLSSMGASLEFWGRGGYRPSYQLRRATGTPMDRDIFRSIRRFQGAERDVEGVDKPVRIVGQFYLTIELFAERFDQPGSKTAPGRRPDRRAAFFGPGQMQPLGFLIGGPGDLDAP